MRLICLKFRTKRKCGIHFNIRGIVMNQIRGPGRYVKRARSTPQKKRNKAFKTCANYWTKNFTTDFLMKWLNFSELYETPYNAFIRINIHRVYNDLEIDPIPPGIV